MIEFCLAVGLAIVISAFCSIAEAALYSIPLGHIEVMVKEGKRSGLLLRKFKQNIPKPITAILTLNTIANTMGAAVAGASAVHLFGQASLGWFSAIFTLLILFFSEIIPKTAGVAYCKQIAPIIAIPLELMTKFFAPIIWLCLKATKLLKHDKDHIFASGREIQEIAAMSQRSGKIDRQEEKTIINILELKNKTVRKAMTPRTVLFSLDIRTTISEANTHKGKWDLHSRVPVYDKNHDDIVGIVLRKDVLIAAAEGKLDVKLEDIMLPPRFVPETAPLPKVLLDFFEHRQHLFVVVDEYGGVTGIISLEDIIEEIMGEEIMDESDRTRDMRELAKFKSVSAKR